MPCARVYYRSHCFDSWAYIKEQTLAENPSYSGVEVSIFELSVTLHIKDFARMWNDKWAIRVSFENRLQLKP